MLALAALLLCSPFAPAAILQEPELVVETLPDGTYVEREVVRDADGRATNHGSYKSWWDDTKAIPRATGRYGDGEKRATWRTYYPDKRRESKGAYADGFRKGAWSYWMPDGEPDLERSGKYTVTSSEHANGALAARGELREGVRHGRWVFHWPNEVVLASGQYAHGELTGPWVLHHPDGTPDPDWVSGLYVEGVRVAPLDEEQRAALVAPESTVPMGDALLGPVWLGGVEVDAADVLRNLERLDLTDPDQVRIGERLVAVLTGYAESLSFAWTVDTTPEAVAQNRTSVRRWTSFWTLLALAPDYAAFEFGRAAARIEARDLRRPLELVHPPFAGASNQAVLAELGPLAARFESDLPQLAKGSEEAIDAGLDWLARHQSPDGSWSSDEFAKLCGEDVANCTGFGQSHRHAGVTGLSLLAFLGRGNTTLEGPYQRTVQRAVAWLLSAQDPTTGQFTPHYGHSWIYSHAIATMAIAEAATCSGNQRLLDATSRGVDFIQRARNPYGAWRYDAPPKGENDTSVTAWMVQALDAGRRAGVIVDAENFVGALSFFDEMTDPQTGRCGYDKRGTPSARIKDRNEEYPLDSSETLTAAALYCRFLMGQRPGLQPVLGQHADLIARRQPEWDPEGFGCDMYGWYYGTYALAQMGGNHWKSWARSLAKAALDSQAQAGHEAGSWDPIGPWGFSGGRVYSTAMMVLALEAPYRIGPLETDAKQR